MFWFTKEWWLYLLQKPLTFRKFRCRIKGHPNGVIWHNIGGLEPDMRCKDCKDNLG
jgi:hypothetical protein